MTSAAKVINHSVPKKSGFRVCVNGNLGIKLVSETACHLVGCLCYGMVQFDEVRLILGTKPGSLEWLDEVVRPFDRCVS